MLYITVTGRDTEKIGQLDIIAITDVWGMRGWVVFDPRERDPDTGHCLQRTFYSFQQAIDCYDQIALQAVIQTVRSLRQCYDKVDYYGCP